MPTTNKKNGSQYWTLNTLIDKFYTSRFNRDNLHDVAENEDIDNSRLYRLYNKADVKELAHIFADFFEWIICEENVSRIRFSDNVSVVRETKLPTIRRANIVDYLVTKHDVDVGQLYITSGKYIWTLFVSGDAFEKMKEKVKKDPEVIAKRKQLEKDLDERNKANDSSKG